MKKGKVGYFEAYALSYFLAAIIAFCAGKQWRYFNINSFDKSMLKKMSKFSIALVPNALLWWVINSSDRLMVSGMRGISENGLYAMGYKLPSLLNTFSAVFMQAWGFSAVKEFDGKSKNDFSEFSTIVITRTAYRLTDKMHDEHPEALGQLSNGHAYDMSTNIFERLPQIFYDEKPLDGAEYIQILGRENNERVYKYVRRDYINTVSNLDKYKIFLPKANGVGALGEILSMPILSDPMIGATETFLSIGVFEQKAEAEAALKYIKTKFARVLLGVLKTTQDITPEKWKCVPLQDFTHSSDIDWSTSIAEIDKQLYKKYNLSSEEIDFIETKVKEME